MLQRLVAFVRFCHVQKGYFYMLSFYRRIFFFEKFYYYCFKKSGLWRANKKLKMSSRLVSDYVWNRYESYAALYAHIVYISQGLFIDNDYSVTVAQLDSTKVYFVHVEMMLLTTQCGVLCMFLSFRDYGMGVVHGENESIIVLNINILSSVMHV